MVVVRWLTILVFTLLILNTLSAVFVIYKTEQRVALPTAQATQAEVNFCINYPPTLDVPCNSTMDQDVIYTCQLNASDPENSTVLYFQIPQPPDNESVFNISATGLINFTPTNNDTGNHSTLIGVDDNSSCDNALVFELFNFSISNINDPPYLIQNIPDQTFESGTTLYAFSLYDYFADPDNDPLNWTIEAGAAEVAITASLDGDTVVFSSDGCGDAWFRFTATDPGNLSAQSNLVKVTSSCVDPGGGDDTSGGGGAAGGGGGAGPYCEEELVCLPWSDCYPNGLQVQVCRDKNGCTDVEIKFYRNCSYVGNATMCEENWLCGEWGSCSIEGVQNRTCFDLNECGTHRYRPALEQECVYVATCFDGVQNGEETGIDCGGPCEACKTIQQPEFLPEVKGFNPWLALLLLIILSVLIALFVLYRERIYEGLAELGWMMAHKHDKEVLLTPAEKQALFKRLATIDEALPRTPVLKTYELLSETVRTFYSYVADIPFEFTEEEFRLALSKMKICDEFEKLLPAFMIRLSLLESGKIPGERLNTLLYDTIIEEFRLLICMTSVYELSEIERELPERQITQQLSFSDEIRLRLLNAYEALQFLKLDEAQNEYRSILRAYDSMALGKREVLYSDIQRLYLEIKYVAETSE